MGLSPDIHVHRALIAGGGAPEIHVSRLLSQYAQTLRGMEAYCFQAYADALEVIPTTLAENAGLNPISIVTELRNRHANGERNAGINVRKVKLSGSCLYLANTFVGPDLEYPGRGCSAAPLSIH
jgi:chaperonin GroEL (HSP60 family)